MVRGFTGNMDWTNCPTIWEAMRESDYRRLICVLLENKKSMKNPIKAYDAKLTYMHAIPTTSIVR